MKSIQINTHDPESVAGGFGFIADNINELATAIASLRREFMGLALLAAAKGGQSFVSKSELVHVFNLVAAAAPDSEICQQLAGIGRGEITGEPEAKPRHLKIVSTNPDHTVGKVYNREKDA